MNYNIFKKGEPINQRIILYNTGICEGDVGKIKKEISFLEYLANKLNNKITLVQKTEDVKMYLKYLSATEMDKFFGLMQIFRDEKDEEKNLENDTEYLWTAMDEQRKWIKKSHETYAKLNQELIVFAKVERSIISKIQGYYQRTKIHSWEQELLDYHNRLAIFCPK